MSNGQWSDLAQWVGPTINEGDGDGRPGESADALREPSRGLVLHIMEGTLDGSVAWGKNPASDVSFHFGLGKSGRLVQLVSVNDRAWTQVAGNGGWHSVEIEGHSGDSLNPAMIEALAKLYARGVDEFGWPLKSADAPGQRGLGWHGMGGGPWGGHYNCPGEPIKAARPAILARAAEIHAERWKDGPTMADRDLAYGASDYDASGARVSDDVSELQGRLALMGVTLPATGPDGLPFTPTSYGQSDVDGRYGRRTAAALIAAIHPWVGGDATGHTYAWGERIHLRRAEAAQAAHAGA